jgi:hypothetical protein
MRPASPVDLAFEDAFAAAREAFHRHDLEVAFAQLERAHVLGQRRTRRHVGVHAWMLRVGWARRDAREVLGQVPRIVAAALFSRVWVPVGNTGGANVPALKPMPLDDAIAALFAADDAKR